MDLQDFNTRYEKGAKLVADIAKLKECIADIKAAGDPLNVELPLSSAPKSYRRASVSDKTRFEITKLALIDLNEQLRDAQAEFDRL